MFLYSAVFVMLAVRSGLWVAPHHLRQGYTIGFVYAALGETTSSHRHNLNTSLSKILFFSIKNTIINMDNFFQCVSLYPYLIIRGMHLIQSSMRRQFWLFVRRSWFERFFQLGYHNILHMALSVSNSYFDRVKPF